MLLAIDWWSICTGAAGSVCGLRHSGPWHFNSVAENIWCFVWFSAVVGQLQSVRRSVPRSILQSGVVAHPDTAGLQWWITCRHPAVPAWATTVSDELFVRLVFSSSRYDHITPFLRQLHWLKALEQIHYELALLVYKCLLGVMPSYLADDLCRPADVEARCRLCSVLWPPLVVQHMWLSAYGNWAFPVAASRVWNGLPHHVTSAQSLPVFRSRLKTHLFRRSLPWLYCCAREVTLVIMDTLIIILTYYTCTHWGVVTLYMDCWPLDNVC